MQNIKDILLRLEGRAFDSELLKDFPIPPAAKKNITISPEIPDAPAGEEAGPGSPAVPQPPERHAMGWPKPELEALPEAPAAAPDIEPEIVLPPAQQVSEQLAIIEPVPVVAAPELPAALPEPPVSLPEFLAALPEPPAAVSPEVPGPEPVAIQPEVEMPESQPVKEPIKKTAGSKVKTLVVFCLGLALAGAGYQVVLNGSWYRLRQASKLERIGDNTRALAAYEQLILKSPRSTEAVTSRLYIGNIKAGHGDRSGAIESYEKFLSLSRADDAMNPEAKFRLAELKFGDGDFFVAGNLYSSRDVRASAYSQKALERLEQIQAVEVQAAEAKKQIVPAPVKAVAAYSALLAAYPEYTKAKAGLEEALIQQALSVKPRAVAPADAAVKARAKLARSILLANRKHLGADTPAKAKAVKTFSLSERSQACPHVWLAEKEPGKLPASLVQAKNSYGCEALKDNVATCVKFRENIRAINALSAGQRAAKVQSSVPGWTLEKQLGLDRKMLNLYEENRCAELLKPAAQSEEQEAPEGF